jgi:hypothetical protein
MPAPAEKPIINLTGFSGNPAGKAEVPTSMNPKNVKSANCRKKLQVIQRTSFEQID